MLVGRFLNGIGCGVAMTISPIYLIKFLGNPNSDEYVNECIYPVLQDLRNKPFCCNLLNLSSKITIPNLTWPNC